MTPVEPEQGKSISVADDAERGPAFSVGSSFSGRAWVFSTVDQAQARELEHAGVSAPLASLLAARGVDRETLVDFLDPKLKNLLPDPSLLANMDRAACRIADSIVNQEKIAVLGDYDVDGVTSTALLVEVLRALGWKVEFYLPHRMDEGYGLSQDGVENCLKKFPMMLMLVVDCGSTAVVTIGWLRERGVDVIVLDHHQVSSPAPDAVALVNPQRRELATRNSELGTAFTELCSVGLAFKLAHAIVKRGRETNLPGAEEFDLRPLLDLVALGTIADLVPLMDENRILASAGLQRLAGLGALVDFRVCETTTITLEGP